jgi:SOS response regulatory protein OraA/RecX
MNDIRDALAESDVDFYEKLLKVASKYVERHKNSPPEKIRERTVRYLAGRGFLFEDICRVLKDIDIKNRA